MSASLAKATRRDIRRAFGDQAIAVVNSQSDSIADALRVIETLNARLTRAEHTTAALHVAYLEHAHQQTARDARQRTLWGRLRLLVCG